MTLISGSPLFLLLFVVTVGILLLSLTIGLLVFQNEKSRGLFMATICTVAAPILPLAIFIVPIVLLLVLQDVSFGAWLSILLSPLVALLVTAVAHLVYLKWSQKPRRATFYWYSVTSFAYSALFFNPIMFATFLGSVWVTIAIVFAVYVYCRGLTCRLYWQLVGVLFGLGIIFGGFPPIGFLVFAQPICICAWWFVCLWRTGVHRMDRGSRQAKFPIAFDGRGYAIVKEQENGGTGAKLYKAFTILYGNHIGNEEGIIRRIDDEVRLFLNCKNFHASNSDSLN